MNVRIILHSILRDKLPAVAQGRSLLNLPVNSTIQDVISLLELPQPVLSSLNGTLNRDQTTILKEGDELRFFRPGAGG